jgi:hypothetical protein
VGRPRVYSDATIRYLDLHIAVAEQDGRVDELAELRFQRSEHEKEVRVLKDAILDGTMNSPDELAVSNAIEGLRSMPLFGKNLNEAVGTDDVEFEGSRFIFIETRRTKKKGKFFQWLH